MNSAQATGPYREPVTPELIEGIPAEVLDQASDMLPDGLFVVDGRRVIRYVNARAGHLLGVPRSQLIGRSVDDAVPLTDHEGRSWWDVIDPWHGLPTLKGHREKLLWTDLGGGKELLVTAKYLRLRRGAPVDRVVMSFRDALARQRAEQDHAALISTVAHELRSPLTSVKGFSATLLRRWDRFTDDQKRLMIETIEADADRVTRLITDLLDVSRIDAGRLTVKRQPLDVGQVLRDVAQRRAAHDEHLGATTPGSGPDDARSARDIVVDCEPDLPEVWADPDRLHQILTNLVDNAVRHGDGTVTLRAVARSPLDGPPAVLLSVADEGAGIPERDLPRIFSRFWHGPGAGNSGLGLYVVRGLVEAHGGTVSVGRSAAGGAELRVLLPAGPPVRPALG